MKFWKPFPKQEKALSYTHDEAFEILFGGARGPGKTDTGMVWLLGEEYENDRLYIHHPRYRALVLRKSYEDLTDWLDRAGNMYKRYGGEVVGKPAQIRFPDGSIFRCGHLKDQKSYMKYLGHEYHRILIEELTQIPDEKYLVQILGSCRSTIDELRPQFFATTNPGGPGHMWVKQRYIDHGEPMEPFRQTDPESGKQSRLRVFVPSTLDDNPVLLEKDPGYVDYLDSIAITDPDLFRAWRYGDWDVFAGQVFSEYRREKHTCKNFLPKSSMQAFLWIDWGYSENSAFAAYLSVLVPMKTEHGVVFNRVFTFHEFYNNRKTPEEWADIIYDWCIANGIHPRKGFTDPAMHNPQTDGSMSIAENMEKRWTKRHGRKWISLYKGNNTRTGRIGRVALMHNWLSDAPDGKPYWIMTEKCKNLIRTLPMLVYDENHVEDVNTTQEDHAYDACGYGLSMVKFIGEVGSFGSREKRKKVRAAPVIVEDDLGRHIPIDLNAFATVKSPKIKDWRAL